MTPFEITMIICAVLIVLLLGTGFYLLCRGLATVITLQEETDSNLRNMDDGLDNRLAHISQQFVNIKDDITDDRRDIVAMLTSINDVVDKMHRNICVDVAEKMVDKAFPIKEGEPLDKPFDNQFVPTGATTWPPCYIGDPCTNPHRDCINCPRPNVSGGTWTTTSNKVETTNNDK